MAKEHPTSEPDEDEYGKVGEGTEQDPKPKHGGKPEHDGGMSGADAADISGPVPGDD